MTNGRCTRAAPRKALSLLRAHRGFLDALRLAGFRALELGRRRRAKQDDQKDLEHQNANVVRQGWRVAPTLASMPA